MSAEPTPVTGPSAAAYPPEPWQLGGSMYVSLWRVHRSELPHSLEAALPDGATPLTIGRRAVVGTAFVRYEPGSVLSYDELLSAVLVHHRGRPRITIPDIWVDSPASVAGGRELWGIPKALATFERSQLRGRGLELRASTDAGPLADLRVVRGRLLPGWRRLPLPTTQRLDGVESTSRVQSLARIRTVRAAWRFPAGSPLHYLEGRRPISSVALEQMAVSFGSATP